MCTIFFTLEIADNFTQAPLCSAKITVRKNQFNDTLRNKWLALKLGKCAIDFGKRRNIFLILENKDTKFQ